MMEAYPNQETFLVERTQRTHINAPWPIDCVYIPPKKKTEKVLLLLHGFGNDGPFMANRFEPLLSEEQKETTAILSPNGPYPLPEKKRSER